MFLEKYLGFGLVVWNVDKGFFMFGNLGGFGKYNGRRRKFIIFININFNDEICGVKKGVVLLRM